MNKRLSIAGLLLGMGLSGILKSFISISMPEIINDLGDGHLYDWVFTSYLLASTISIPFFAKLADIKSRKLLYCLGEAIIFLFLLLSSLADSMPFFIICRFFIGLGAGISVPCSWALLTDICEEKELPKLMGISGIVQVIANVIGPVWGGAATEFLDWRLGLLTLLPIVILSIIFIYLGAPEKRRQTDKFHIDYAGTVLVAVIITLLLVSINLLWISLLGFIVSILLSIVLCLCFIRHEGKTLFPVIPLQLFQSKPIVFLTILAFLYGAFSNSVTAYLPLLFANNFGSSSSQSGIMFLPMMIAAGIGSWLCGKTPEEYRNMLVSCIWGGAALSSVLFSVTASGNIFFTVGLTLSFGLATGYALPLIMSQSLNLVNKDYPEHIGVSSGVLQLMRNMGGTLGVAALGFSLQDRDFRAASIFLPLTVIIAASLLMQILTGRRKI